MRLNGEHIYTLAVYLNTPQLGVFVPLILPNTPSERYPFTKVQCLKMYRFQYFLSTLITICCIRFLRTETRTRHRHVSYTNFVSPDANVPHKSESANRRLISVQRNVCHPIFTKLGKSFPFTHLYVSWNCRTCRTKIASSV